MGDDSQFKWKERVLGTYPNQKDQWTVEGIVHLDIEASVVHYARGTYCWHVGRISNPCEEKHSWDRSQHGAMTAAEDALREMIE